MLALPPFEHESGLLVGANRTGVRRDRLKVDPAQVAPHEPELDELGDRGRPDAAAPRLGHQADPGLGMVGEGVEPEQ